MNIKKIFNLIMAIAFAFSLLGIPASALAQEYSPNIQVTTSRLQIIGSGWPVGSEITLSIDGVANGAGVDYTEKTTMQPSSWDPYTIVANFDLNGNFTFYPGDVITMTDGSIPMTYTVQVVTLTNIDTQADTASGTGTPGDQLLICVSWIDFCAFRRYVIVDSSGDWVVDFSQPGPDGQETIDILPGYNVRVIDQDEYGNHTCEFWDVQFPDMEVTTNTPQHIIGSGWLIGSEIILSIDSASNGVGIDYTEKTTMQPTQWDANSIKAIFQLDQKFTLHPGDIITMTDGVTPINYTVQELELTNINVQTGVVSGTGTPGDQLLICVSRTNFCTVRRYVTVDSSEDWIADFGQPGPEGQETIILQPGDEVRPIDQDENGNRTVQLWTVPIPPYFTVRANYDHQVEAYLWDMGDTLTLTIDNPATANNPDYTATQTTGTAPWDPSQTYVLFNFSDAYDIQLGDVVDISNGSITKTTVVSNLTITNVHLDTDIVEGTAEPSQIINVRTCWQDICANRDETAAQDGHWLANFAIPGEQDWEQDTLNIQPGSWIDSSVSDEDYDSTMFGWYVPTDMTPPTITWVGNISIGYNYYFDFVPSEPTCIANDLSGVDGPCIVMGYSTTIGAHTLTATARDMAGNIATEKRSYTVLPWTLKGFYQPVDMNDVYNIVKGDSTVPLKFEIFASSTELTDIAYIKSLTYVQTSCDVNATTDEIETIATGNTSLRYLDGQFIYNWKTPNTAGRCYRVTMTTIDNSTLVAYFKLK